MKSRIHWLGKSINELPASCMNALREEFNVNEYADDISVLSEPNVHFCVVYLSGSETLPIACVSTLCKNLNKRLFVLLEKGCAVDLPDHSVVCEQHELDVKSFPKWLKYLDKKYYSASTDANNNHTTVSGELLPRTKEINKVLRYVEQNLHKEVREEDVAALCHYSASYFSKYFRKHLGVCFRDYLIEKRLTLAKDLLKNQPNVKIAYIAYQCGYQDISYFARIFKKRVGVSPATYRQQYLKAKTSIHHKSA